MATLSSGALDLALSVTTAGDGIKLDSLTDTNTSTELLLNSPSDYALFKISLFNESDSSMTTIESGVGWSSPTVSTTATTADLTFTTHTSIADISVDVTASAITSEDAIAWDISITNNSTTWSVYDVRFPGVELVELTNGEYVEPHQNGESYGYVGQSFTRQWSVPSGTEGQYMAAVGDNSGLYAGYHDPAPMTKQHTGSCNGINGLRLTYHTFAEDLTLAGNDFVHTGSCVWKLLGGGDDWFDVAKYYRQWAESNASWWPTSSETDVAGRTDTPQWLRDIPVWVNYHPENRNRYASYEDGADRLLEMQEFFGGVPMGVHWYGWHEHDFDTHYPDYFPARQGFVDTIERLQENDLYVVPYINSRLWDTANDASSDKPFSEGQPAAVSYRDGTIYTESYGGPEDLAVMCPATQLWQDTLVEIATTLTDTYGVDGIYLDQVSNRVYVNDSENFTADHNRTVTDELPFCHNDAHPHPRGGGTWWFDGYRDIIQSIQDATPDDVPVVGETAGEWYASEIDGGLVFPWGRKDSDLPMHPAVYGGGTYAVFGRAYGGKITTPGMCVLTAQSLVWGNQLGWWNGDFHIDEPEAADFAAKCVQMRHRLTPFFTNGEYEQPLSLNVPTITTTDSQGATIESPAIENGVWRQEAENEVAFVFANPTNDTQSSSTDITLSDYGISGSAQLIRYAHGGVAAPGETVSNSFTKTITVEPRDVSAWVVSKQNFRDVTGTRLS